MLFSNATAWTNAPGPERILQSSSMFLHKLLLLTLALALGGALTAQAAAKRVLVVTLTKSFHHSSIPTGEKVLGQLAQQSGAFTVDFVRTEADMAQKMTPAALTNVDAVIFANTTGDLPLPDKQAFLDWIKAGHGFIGIHAACDTFHGFPAYLQMLGAEFDHHPPGLYEVECINQDPKHPACLPLGPTWKVKDEIYLMKGFDRAKVHGLLTLDKHPSDHTPGDYPIAWCKNYGTGRVFYTSLGHNDDIWDADTPPNFKRVNPPEVSRQYQQHLLGGIKWALGLAPGDATPQKAGTK